MSTFPDTSFAVLEFACVVASSCDPCELVTPYRALLHLVQRKCALSLGLTHAGVLCGIYVMLRSSCAHLLECAASECLSVPPQPCCLNLAFVPMSRYQNY